jgi:hypothetical protein
MSLFKLHRALISKGPVLLLAAALLVAQLAIVTHSHASTGKQEGQTTDLRCAFCVAGTHLQSGPSLPVVHLHRANATRFDVAVRHVCANQVLVSPRLTRGPPSTTCPSLKS